MAGRKPHARTVSRDDLVDRGAVWIGVCVVVCLAQLSAVSASSRTPAPSYSRSDTTSPSNSATGTATVTLSTSPTRTPSADTLSPSPSRTPTTSTSPSRTPSVTPTRSLTPSSSTTESLSPSPTPTPSPLAQCHRACEGNQCTAFDADPTSCTAGCTAGYMPNPHGAGCVAEYTLLVGIVVRYPGPCGANTTVAPQDREIASLTLSTSIHVDVPVTRLVYNGTTCRNSTDGLPLSPSPSPSSLPSPGLGNSTAYAAGSAAVVVVTITVVQVADTELEAVTSKAAAMASDVAIVSIAGTVLPVLYTGVLSTQDVCDGSCRTCVDDSALHCLTCPAGFVLGGDLAGNAVPPTFCLPLFLSLNVTGNGNATSASHAPSTSSSSSSSDGLVGVVAGVVIAAVAAVVFAVAVAWRSRHGARTKAAKLWQPATATNSGIARGSAAQNAGGAVLFAQPPAPNDCSLDDTVDADGTTPDTKAATSGLTAAVTSDGVHDGGGGGGGCGDDASTCSTPRTTAVGTSPAADHAAKAAVADGDGRNGATSVQHDNRNADAGSATTEATTVHRNHRASPSKRRRPEADAPTHRSGVDPTAPATSARASAVVPTRTSSDDEVDDYAIVGAAQAPRRSQPRMPLASGPAPSRWGLVDGGVHTVAPVRTASDVRVGSAVVPLWDFGQPRALAVGRLLDSESADQPEAAQPPEPASLSTVVGPRAVPPRESSMGRQWAPETALPSSRPSMVLLAQHLPPPPPPPLSWTVRPATASETPLPGSGLTAAATATRRSTVINLDNASTTVVGTMLSPRRVLLPLRSKRSLGRGRRTRAFPATHRHWQARAEKSEWGDLGASDIEDPGCQ